METWVKKKLPPPDPLGPEVIDGSTLDKRRDQRKEQLERFVGQLTPEDRKGVVGFVNQASEVGVRVVPASQSMYDLNAPTKQLRQYEESHTFELPPIIKRTPEQRLESLINRLGGAPQEQIAPLLEQIHVEGWKRGIPVTADALRAAASHLLNRTERRH